MKEKPDRAQIIAPPPLLGLGCIALGFVARHFSPLRLFPLPEAVRLTIGVGLCVFGATVLLAARRQFITQGTPLNPYKPTAALVTIGIYGLSRNPIYVGFLFIVTSFAFLANSAWFFASALVLFFLLGFGVIRREERYLSEKFGDAYLAYCQRVRRWV
jgi:protein-S-isoprenylcysteine O-methyltransferase Ste14